MGPVFASASFLFECVCRACSAWCVAGGLHGIFRPAEDFRMISEPLDSFAFEVALRETKLCAALLPPSHVPVLWLRELAIEAYPAFATTPQALDVLMGTLYSQGILRADRGSAAVAQVDEGGVRQVRDAADEGEVVATKKRLRAFCARRLSESRSESTERVNRVMTGDPMTAVTAWSVPPIEEVKARAAGDDRVEVVDYGDGTYSVRARPVRAWEDECLIAFAGQEFASEDHDGIEWSLRAGLLTVEVLQQGRDRVGELHLREPESTQAALVAGLFWLSLAHRGYGEGGSCRVAWSLSGQAVDILQRVRERQPDDPAVAALLAEAERARWSYDD